MKQKNMWLHLTLLLIGLIISKVQCAQIPQPTSFISVSSGNKNFVNESLNASEIWYKWTNTNDATNIKIKLKNQGSNAIITNAELYLLVNDSLTLINADTLGTDSIIDFWNRDIAVNSSIFIKIAASYSLCTSCLLVNASYELKLTNININSAYTASTCELVRDGELDTRWITGCNFHTITLASNFPATFWSVPPQSNSTISTPDYFADCAPLTPLINSVNTNSNFASNGLCTINTNTVGAYTGMYVYNPLSPYREYLTNQLSQPVQVGKPYHLSLMVRLSCFSKYAISNLSLYFTNGAPVQPSVLLTSWQSGVMTPTAGVLVNFTTTPVTNTSDWTILTACFTPTAAFSHITLGNFETSINTTATDLDVSNSWPYSVAGTTPNTYNKASYYYFDKVSVKPIELIATGTATLCSGASSQLDAFLDCPLSNSYTPTYSWTPSYGLSATNISNPVANPTVTTQYTVSATIPNANGVSCAVTRTVLITAGSGVNPTITITPTQTICQGQSASITAGGATTYTWNTGSTNNPLSVNPTINTNYNVIGTNAAGCTSTATTSIIVIPTLPVSLSPSSSMCLGSSVTLTASNGVSTYTWLPNGTASGGSTVTLTPTVTTTYTVLNYNSCNILNSAVATVSVFPSPSYSLTSTNICVGSSISVISNSTTSITNLNFNYPNPITPATSQSPYTYNTAGNYSVEVTGENTVGGFCQTTTIFPVTVSALQPFAITYTSLPCSFNYTFTENFGCSSNVYDYTFDVNNGAYNITNNTGIFPYTFTASGTYTITGFSSYDYIPVTFTINVPPATTPTITLVASPSKTICAGSSVTLTASGGTTYTWTPTGLNTNTITVSPTVTTVYSVTSDCGIVKTITITVVPNVTLTASASPTSICSGQSSTLSVSGAPSYTWMPGGMTSSVTVVSPTVTTTYTVTGANGICVDTKTVQVTVNPTPTINIITTNYSVCPGGIVIFNGTSAGVSTYTWAPCSSLCNTPGKNFYPTVTTTYTLSGTSAQGCVGKKTITIVVVPIPTITVNSATICAGNSATLTASGSNTFTWSPMASNASSIIVTPSVTTTYTVSGKNTGCATSSTKTSTVTVSNGTIPSFSIVAPNSGNICANGTGTNVTTFSTSLSNTGLYGFTWTPGNSTSATPNISITQPISVGVTVRDLACGTSSVQDVCINYVASSCCNNTLTTLTNTTITDVAQIPNSTYKVVGTLTFNLPNPASVSYKEFLMSTGSKIIVTPTTSMQFRVCKLYSCEGMWEGIELQNTSTNAASIDINDGTTIEDAYVAVSANSYTTNLGNRIVLNIANFNKNYIDVQMKDWVSAGNTYNFTSLSSNFTSTSTATSPGGNLKCSQYYSPTIKARSAVGIYALNTTSVAVGAINTNTFYINTFNNKDYGIVYEKTSGNVTNARFSNMSGLNGTCQTIGCTPPLPTGIGVYATTNNSTPTYINISSTPAPVTFTNVECAVYAKKITDLSVLSTSITNTSQGAWNNFSITSGIGYNGIYTEDIKRELHVNYNLINNAYYGVQSNYTNAANLSLLSISNNTIQTTSTTFTTMLGINVSSAISFAGVPANKPIAANKLYLVRTGVRLTGLNTGVRVSNNAIDMVSGNGSNTTGSAIFLNGGNSACIIDNNTIRGNSTGAVTTYNYNKLGINVKTSTNCLVKCNTINAVGTGVRYEGVCNTSNDGFFSNTLNGPIRRGVELKTSASIGTQGAYTGTPPSHVVTQVSKNQWAGTWTAANSDQTYVYDAGSNAGASRLCVGTSSSELPIDNQWNTAFASFGDSYGNGAILSSATAPAVSTCPGVLTQGLRVAGVNDSLETMERDKEFKLIITQNLNDPMLDTETKWQLKNYMYSAIDNGTAPQDLTVQGFYSQEKTGSIDDYTTVDSLIEAGDYAQALAVNSSANANVVTEQTTKDYNALWLSKFSNPDYVATTSDIVTITDIANQCIHKGGNAVAYARALLNAIYNHPFDYDDDCTEYKPNLRIAQNTKNFESNGNEIHLYPNPNNGIFTLSYNLAKDITEADVMITDVTGKLMYQDKLYIENHNIILKLQNAQNGIYFVKVMSGKVIISVNKVIVNN